MKRGYSLVSRLGGWGGSRAHPVGSSPSGVRGDN